MDVQLAPRDPDEVAQLRAEVAALRGELQRHTAPAARPPRRRPSRRFLPLALVALLVALVPLATLAANPFNDLTGGVHDPNIDAIYNAGITTGCVPNVSYCPTDNVTRQEMASFLARTAGLGANKPVANAARLSVSPAAVGSATYAANDLVRVARAVKPNGLTAITATTAAYQTWVTLTIAAPTAGFVLVNGTAGAQNGGACTGTNCNVFMRLRDVGAATVAPYAVSAVDNANVPNTSLGVTYVFPVSAGTQTFTMEVAKNAGAGTLYIGGAELSAVFVPFGSAGADTLGNPEPTTDDGQQGR